MPQMHLPFFPDGVEHITSELAVEKRDGQVTYFNGHMPVFIHAEADTPTFRMITAQFCINGNAKQADISRAFGVTLISVKRAVKLYREKGVSGFYEQAKRRGPAVLTAQVLAQAQGLLDEGLEVHPEFRQVGVAGRQRWRVAAKSSVVCQKGCNKTKGGEHGDDKLSLPYPGIGRLPAFADGVS